MRYPLGLRSMLVCSALALLRCAPSGLAAEEPSLDDTAPALGLDASADGDATEARGDGRADAAFDAATSKGDASASETDGGGVDGDVNGTLLFHSGYEGSVSVAASNTQTDILTGTDTTLAAPNDWLADFDGAPGIGRVGLSYEAGDASQRRARVIEEPGNAANHVLQFVLAEPNVPTLKKGRVQMDVYGNTGLEEALFSSRVFLPTDFESMRTYPGTISWLTLAEIWNNGTWTGEGHPFRITLDLTKPSAAVPSALYLHVHAQTIQVPDGGAATFDVVWERSDTTFPVPIGTWFQLDVYVKQGNASAGRFYAAVTPAGGTKQVVFDVQDVTHHPADPAPNGFGNFNPQKLYTSAKLIQHFKSQGTVMNILWDDFQVWKSRHP